MDRLGKKTYIFTNDMIVYVENPKELREKTPETNNRYSKTAVYKVSTKANCFSMSQKQRSRI